MSVNSSSSVLPSVKIPCCLDANWKIKASLPYVINLNPKNTNHKKERKSSYEMVSLRIPNAFNKEKENCISCSDVHKEEIHKSSKTVNKKINIVSVPVKSSFHRHTVRLKSSFKTLQESNFKKDSDEKFLEFNIEEIKYCDSVPYIKPWTEDELNDIKRKQNSVEELVKRKVGKRKKN